MRRRGLVFCTTSPYLILVRHPVEGLWEGVKEKKISNRSTSQVEANLEYKHAKRDNSGNSFHFVIFRLPQSRETKQRSTIDFQTMVLEQYEITIYNYL